MTQWILRCKDGFVVYHYGAGVSKETSIENATVFTPDLHKVWGDSVMDLAKERGYEDLEWKAVKVEEIQN